LLFPYEEEEEVVMVWPSEKKCPSERPGIDPLGRK
jgi:hypothetical protein